MVGIKYSYFLGPPYTRSKVPGDRENVFLLIVLCYVWCYPEYFYHKVLGQQIEPRVYTYPQPTHFVKHGGHENYGHDHTR